MAEVKAIVGRDDWLFLDQDANHVQAQITGKFALSENFEMTWASLGAYRKAAFEARGIPYVFLIAPNKECVYSEYLPEGTSLSPLRPVSKVLTALESNLRVLYPLAELKESRSIRETYPRGDTHWNQYGSFVVYQLLMKIIGIDPMKEGDIDFHTQIVDGDLSSKIGLNTEYISARLKIDRTKITENNGVKNIGQYLVLENENKSLPKLVLFRDSFSTSLLAMISQHFSRLVVVWQPNIDYGIVDREQPDYVISQQAERFLISPPDDVRGLSHEQYVSRKS